MGKCLTFAGKVCLLKFVITSFSLFYIRNYKKFGIREVRVGKQHGQLGIRYVNQGARGLDAIDVRTFNFALLGKWLWLAMENEDLQKEILKSKYEGWRELRNLEFSKAKSFGGETLKLQLQWRNWGNVLTIIFNGQQGMQKE